MAVKLFASLLWFGCFFAYAQTGVTGQATLSFQDGGTDCSGSARLVEVYADVTGLTGTASEPVGLNSFVLSLTLAGSVSSDVFSSVYAGDHPDFSWHLQYTAKDQVISSHTLKVVGWAAYPDVPSSQHYHLCTLLLAGTAQNVTVTLNTAESSLASRVVDPPDGDGPGLVGIAASTPFATMIPSTFSLELNTGASHWREASATYDLMAPFGIIDVIDLTKIVTCGG